MTHPCRYSMVVDWPRQHPYQAEVLLHTLRENAGAPPEAIVVQCTTRVGDDVRAEFRRAGHAVVEIAPYLDGVYCNKIAQLDHFAARPDDNAQGVFLLDLDVAILAPLDIPDPTAVCGKIVDGDNPPLPIIRRLFAAAEVPLPPLKPSDWQGRGDTIATNLNGGFLYLPMDRIESLRAAWRKWAEFLFARPDLFGPRGASEAAFKHVDQLAFALALAADDVPLRHLPTNWNFPGHKDRQPRLHRQNEPVCALHYHDCLDAFGLLAPKVRGFAALDQAVERVNASIGGKPATEFFERFKRQRALEAVCDVPTLPKTTFSAEFLTRARTPQGGQRRLILHAGAPKTGTSSLQRHLGEHRVALAAKGWWYPQPSDAVEPKHQQLNALLRRGDSHAFAAHVEAALRAMPDDAHTVIFSTEGIFNHWWDYAPWAKAALRHLAALFDFELCVWLRPPDSFAAALYVQYLANPPSAEEPRHVYGRDIDFATALADPWFRRHLDCLGFLHEARLLFGASRVRAFPSGEDTVRAFIDEYDVPLPPQHERWNPSLRNAGVEAMRIANRVETSGHERDRVTALVRELDDIVGERSGPFRLREREREAVLRFGQRCWYRVQAGLLADQDAIARRRRRVLTRQGRKYSKVFCIGFHRTGTKSLAEALRVLGCRTVGPMGAREPDIGRNALVKALAVATEFDAFGDNPWPPLYEQLDATFPGSAFILTIRATSAWLESVVGYFGDEDTPMRQWIYGAGRPRGNESRYIERYERHNAAVRSYFKGRNDLLTMNMEAGDGWRELCDFLDAPVPDIPFPHRNQRSEHSEAASGTALI